MKLYTVLAQELIDLHTGPIFGLLGDANLHLIHDVEVRRPGTFVATDTETGAVVAGSGWAQAHGETAVVSVTHGPAVAHAFLRLVEASRGRIPMVVIAGDTSTVHPHPLQDIDQQSVIAPTGAQFIDVTSSADAPSALRTAFEMARDERRPVVVNIPVNIQKEEVPEPVPAPSPAAPPPPAPAPQESLIEEATPLLLYARRPIILAGRGAVSPAARGALIRLAQQTGARLATTLRAKDLFRAEPANIGIFGSLATTEALTAIQAADCVAVFGASLNLNTTEHGTLLTGKVIIRCDLDELPDDPPSGELRLRGDVGAVATRISELIERVEPEAVPEAAPEQGAASESAAVTRTATHATTLSPPTRTDTSDKRAGAARVHEGMVSVLTHLEALIAPERTLVTDVGRFMIHAQRHLSVTDARHYVHAANFSSIGLGMGTAIGAALARPQAPCLLISRDGGFMHGGVVEFPTAVRNQLDLVVVVMNDSAYGAEHIQFRQEGLDPALSQFRWPDLVAVAEAMGTEAVRMRPGEPFTALDEAYRRRRGPLLIDVHYDPDDFPPLNS